MAILMGSYSELEKRLISAAYYTSNRLDKDTISISEIVEEFDFPMPERFLTIALKDLWDMRYSEEQMFGGALLEQRITLTAQGIREAENIIERGETDVLEFKIDRISVPAADRFVNSSDNQDDRAQAISLLDALEKQIRDSNEGGDIFSDDRMAIADEVHLLRRLISSARVRVAAVVDTSKTTLAWIAEKAGGAAIGELAKRALQHILDWLS